MEDELLAGSRADAVLTLQTRLQRRDLASAAPIPCGVAVGDAVSGADVSQRSPRLGPGPHRFGRVDVDDVLGGLEGLDSDLHGGGRRGRRRRLASAGDAATEPQDKLQDTNSRQAVDDVTLPMCQKRLSERLLSEQVSEGPRHRRHRKNSRCTLVPSGSATLWRIIATFERSFIRINAGKMTDIVPVEM